MLNDGGAKCGFSNACWPHNKDSKLGHAEDLRIFDCFQAETEFSNEIEMGDALMGQLWIEIQRAAESQANVLLNQCSVLLNAAAEMPWRMRRVFNFALCV